MRDRVDGERGGAAAVALGVGAPPAEDGDPARGGRGEGARRAQEHPQGGEAPLRPSLPRHLP